MRGPPPQLAQRQMPTDPKGPRGTRWGVLHSCHVWTLDLCELLTLRLASLPAGTALAILPHGPEPADQPDPAVETPGPGPPRVCLGSREALSSGLVIPLDNAGRSRAPGSNYPNCSGCGWMRPPHLACPGQEGGGGVPALPGAHVTRALKMTDAAAVAGSPQGPSYPACRLWPTQP